MLRPTRNPVDVILPRFSLTATRTTFILQWNTLDFFVEIFVLDSLIDGVWDAMHIKILHPHSFFSDKRRSHEKEPAGIW